METQLESDLKKLPLWTNDGFVDIERVLASRKISIELWYDFYKNLPKEWNLSNSTLTKMKGYKNQVIDWNIKSIKPFYEEFTVEKFWFKNEEWTDKINQDAIVGFKDGVNTVFYKGDYLDGGEMFSAQVVPKKKQDDFLGILNSIGDSQESEMSSNSFSKFVYAYFPPKLYLSPNERNYFILTQGKHLLRSREQSVIRFYFNLKPKNGSIDTSNVDDYIKSVENFKSDVKYFVKTIEDYLNESRIPFQFKLPTSIENFQRADTFVLYIAQKHYYYLYEFIRKHSEKCKHIFGEISPLFTKQFDGIEGVSIAEDPDIAGDSFGMNRCTLIYEIIKNLSENQANKDKITINHIIQELKEKGYDENNFFRNPYINFDYSIKPYHKIDLEAIFGNTYPQNTRYYLYAYGKVAFYYALDLVQRAIWLNSEEITWITYYEENEEKGYRFVTADELNEIFWFLYQILKFEWMRKSLPNNLVSIIFSKVTEIKSNPKYKDKILENFKKAKYDYKYLTDEIEKYIESFDKNWVENAKFIAKNFLDLSIKRANNIQNYWEILLNATEGDDIPPIYGINKGDFDITPDLIQNARKIYYKFAKPLYPIKNKYGNYEYCPTTKGKLQIAMVMLFVYCPSLFEELQ